MATKKKATKKAKPSKVTDAKVRANVQERARQVVKERAMYERAGKFMERHTIGSVLMTSARLPKSDQLRIAAHYRFRLEWNAADKKIDKFAKRLGLVIAQAQELFDHYEV